MDYKIVFNSGNELIVEDVKDKASATVKAINDGKMSKDDCFDIVGIFPLSKEPEVTVISPKEDRFSGKIKEKTKYE